jgi:hypothetical protein
VAIYLMLDVTYSHPLSQQNVHHIIVEKLKLHCITVHVMADQEVVDKVSSLAEDEVTSLQMVWM